MSNETKRTNTLPCGSCRLCCHSEAIILHPEDGDNPDDFETAVIEHPLHGNLVFIIKPKESGDTACRYLGPFGCSIYARRPAICRSFDCRRMVLKVPKHVETKIVFEGKGTREVFDKGREMLKRYPL